MLHEGLFGVKGKLPPFLSIPLRVSTIVESSPFLGVPSGKVTFLVRRVLLDSRAPVGIHRQGVCWRVDKSPRTTLRWVDHSKMVGGSRRPERTGTITLDYHPSRLAGES